MEEAKTDTTPQLQDANSPTQKPFIKRPNIVILIVILFALLLGASVFALRSFEDREQREREETRKDFESLAPLTLIYGYWTPSNSIIEAVDLQTGDSAVIADLPSNIKRVSIPFNNIIYFISDTNFSDYGQRLTAKNLASGQESVIISADDGFGIDDYKVSTNGRYVAIWMLELAENSDQLNGGKSRVYIVDTSSNNSKNLIYDETSGPQTPVHYPIGITDIGDLFSDTFLPNSGAGWAYGMSYSSSDGSVKNDISEMRNGTYSTQPVMSKDGIFLAFAGYSGSDGLAIVDNSFRKALVVPNTIELLNIESGQRVPVETGLENAIYSSVSWDPLSNNLLFNAVYREADNVVNSQFAFNPNTSLLQKLDVPQSTNNQSNIVASVISDGNYLLVDKLLGQSDVGNLGSAYEQLIGSVSIYQSSGQGTTLNIKQAPIQIISIKPSLFFENMLKNNSFGASSRQLQLQTFVLKPTLAPVREFQQTSPRRQIAPEVGEELPLCRDIGYPQCNAMLGTDYPVSKDLGDLNDPAFSECAWKQFQAGQANGTCAGSPLYLYGKSGQKINVSVNTSIYNPNVKFSKNRVIATLGSNNTIIAGDSVVSGIEFDFRPATRILKRPESGVTIERNNLEKVLSKIAQEFRFNSQETKDLINFSKSVQSDYVFVSFYDDKTSKQILPIQFDPVPDTYRSVIFYFKKVDRLSESNKLPEIVPIIRNGLTAIEISYIVD